MVTCFAFFFLGSLVGFLGQMIGRISCYTFFLICCLLCFACWKTFPTLKAFAINHFSDFFSFWMAFFWLWISMWLTNWWIFNFMSLYITLILEFSDSCDGIKLFWYLLHQLLCYGCWLAEFVEPFPGSCRYLYPFGDAILAELQNCQLVHCWHHQFSKQLFPCIYLTDAVSIYVCRMGPSWVKFGTQ